MGAADSRVQAIFKLEISPVSDTRVAGTGIVTVRPSRCMTSKVRNRAKGFSDKYLGIATVLWSLNMDIYVPKMKVVQTITMG